MKMQNTLIEFGVNVYPLSWHDGTSIGSSIGSDVVPSIVTRLDIERYSSYKMSD